MAREYGHVKMSRKAFESDPFWLESRVFSRWEAWQDLIQMAAWKSQRRAVGASVVELRRGEILVSVRYLARRWRWSKNKVAAFLQLLEEMGRIAGQRKGQAGTAYLLVNYERYQGAPSADGTPSGHLWDTNEDTLGDTGGTPSGTLKPHDDNELPGGTGHLRDAIRDASGTPAPGISGQREGSKEDDASQLVSQSNRGGGEARVIPLPVAARSDDRAELIRTAVALANRGMRDNPRLGDRARPIHANGTAQQIVGDWLDEGIPWDVIAETVYETALSFVPSEGNRQIHSMAYFSAAVRTAADEHRAEADAESVPTPRRKTNGGQNENHRRGTTREVSAAAERARPVALGAGDPSRRSGWVYE